MIDDPRGAEPSDNLPSGVEAFTAEDPAEREAAAYVAARAGSLLALVPPQRGTPPDDRLADEEARELLGVDPVPPMELDRGEVSGLLREAGPRGAALAEILDFAKSRERREEVRYAVDAVTRDADPATRRAVHDAQRDAADRTLRRDRGQADWYSRRGDAARLVVSSMLDEDEVVRVAAAASTLRVDDGNEVAEAILASASESRSAEVAELARAALVNTRRYEQRIIEFEGHGRATETDAPDAVLVHGTWARWGRWWQPGGELHDFLRSESVFPGLYCGADTFTWSGYFSFRTWAGVRKDWQRMQAGSHLAWWTERKLARPPDVIGHSYGGSIAMLTTVVEKPVRGLVLLSPAVHRTCLPNPGFYEELLLVRMPLDLVLMIDRSKPRLLADLPRVTERVLPRRGRTGHFGTHDPEVWLANGLEAYVRDEWCKKLTPRGP